MIIGFYGFTRGVAAVLVGAYDSSGELRLLGRVGSGFASRTRQDLYALLAPHRGQHPAGQRAVGPLHQWVTPTFVAEVEYRRYLGGGQGLRHASYKGLRLRWPANHLGCLPVVQPQACGLPPRRTADPQQSHSMCNDAGCIGSAIQGSTYDDATANSTARRS